MNTKSLLHYFLVAILTVLPVKHVLSGSEEEKEGRIRTANEELVDESLNYYGGDIILTDWQKKMLEGKEDEAHIIKDGDVTEEVSNERAHNVNRRAVVKNGAYLWPKGIVPYVIDNTLSSTAVNAIRAAMSEFEEKTCIQFVKRTSQSDYIRFIKDNGCYSYVGRTSQSGQAISVGRGCEYKGIVIHEIFHALGRWHEQSRPDRDNYIKINFQNIRSGTSGNFNKLSTDTATTQSISYDLRSIMHYDAYAFSINGRPTIESRVSGIRLSSIGQRQGFTNLDLQHVNTLYECSSQPTGGVGSWGSWSRWSSCSVTCDGGIAVRTRTCMGSGCTGQSRQTRSCNTNNCPVVNSNWGQWESWSSCSLTCNRGRRERSRGCEPEGSTCFGVSTQIQYCNTEACPTTTTSNSWGPWSSWTPCHSTCGGGLRFRSRKCLSYTYSGCRSGRRYELKSCGRWQCSRSLASAPEHHPGNNTQLTNTDAKHISCQALNFQTDHLLLSLKNKTTTVFSGPFQAEEAKHMCINLAKSMNYTYVGIMGGYCISVQGLLDNRQVHDECQHGIGKYDPSSLTQYVDVYRINTSSTEEEELLKSFQGINGATVSVGFAVSYYLITVLLLAVILQNQ